MGLDEVALLRRRYVSDFECRVIAPLLDELQKLEQDVIDEYVRRSPAERGTSDLSSDLKVIHRTTLLLRYWLEVAKRNPSWIG